MEIVFWPPGSTPPDGSYVAGAVHISGAPTTGTLDVFQGANRLDLTTDQGRVQTVNFTSEPIVPGTGNEGQALGIARVFAPDAQAATAQSVKKKPRQTSVQPAGPGIRRR
jgi:hypothetical protein